MIDPLLLAQSIAVIVVLYLAVLTIYMKGLADKILCLEHSYVIGQMFWHGHIDSKTATNQIFNIIHDDKY